MLRFPAITLLAAVFAANGFGQEDWVPQASGVTVTLHGVACAGPDSAWAVGAEGTILRTTDGGRTWTPQRSQTGEDLHGVSFIDSRNGWVAGAGPVILRTTDAGENWQSQVPGTGNGLRGIAFADADRGWAVGDAGTIVGTTDGGDNWASEISGVFGVFTGVTVASPSAAWAIGSDPFGGVAPVYHHDGTGWTRQYDITRNRNGRSISVTGGLFLWATADSGTVVHSTDGGAGWAEQNSGTAVGLAGASAVSASHCWVVGAGGTIRRTGDGGATWEMDVSQSVSDLHAVCMLDSLNGRAVGADGRILYRTGGVGLEERETRPVAGRFATVVGRELRLSVPGPAEVRLYDSGGRLVRAMRPGAAPALRLDGVPAGTYIVGVSAAGRREWFRFVKVN